MRGNLARPDAKGLDIIRDYLGAVADLREDGCLYRGHACCDWQVIASRFRPGVVGLGDKVAFDEWKAIARRFVSPQPVRDIEFLVLAQHYGIPTALLDWTENPLIALFFACQPEKKKSAGRVIRVSRSEFKLTSINGVKCFPSSQAERPLFDTAPMNVRSMAQDSFMSLHTETERPLVTTTVFDIEWKNKWYVSQALALFGITLERIYADINIAAQQFIMRHLNFEWAVGDISDQE